MNQPVIRKIPCGPAINLYHSQAAIFAGLLADDAVGIRLVLDFSRRLGNVASLEIVEECTAGGIDLLQIIESFDRLLLVDGIKTREGVFLGNSSPSKLGVDFLVCGMISQTQQAGISAAGIRIIPCICSTLIRKSYPNFFRFPLTVQQFTHYISFHTRKRYNHETIRRKQKAAEQDLRNAV